jgi:hypothetical protein
MWLGLIKLLSNAPSPAMSRDIMMSRFQPEIEIDPA